MNPSTPNNLGINYVSASQLNQPQQQSEQGDGGNWFTHLLPTAGGVLGGIGGGLLTAGLGGEVVGAGGGAALGKALENALEGKQAIQGDDLTAGVEGAVGQGVGGLVGKALGAGASLLANRGTQLATDTAEQAATKAATDEAVSRAVQTKNNFGGISSRLQGDLKLGQNQGLLKGLGYDETDPYMMRQASLAGHDPSGGPSLNAVYDEALQGAKPVNMSGFGNDTFKILKNSGTEDLSSSPLGKVLADFNTRTNGAYGNGTNVELPDNMSAADVRKLQQSVGREMSNQQTLINNAAKNGITNAPAEASHSTLADLYDQLGGKIKTPEVDQAVAARVTTPEERTALVAKFGDTHGNQIADTIDKAQSANDLLGPMQNYTQMGKLSDMAINDIENATATGRNLARVKAEAAAPETQAPNAPGLMTHLADAGGLLSALSGHPQGLVLPLLAHGAPLAGKIAQNPGILQTLGRIGALGSKLAPAAGTAIATSPNLAADPTGMMNTNATMGGAMNSPMPMTAQPNQQQQLIDALTAQAILAPSAYGGTATPYLQSVAPMLQKNRMLESELGALPGFYGNAGGAQGTAGILSLLTSHIPGTAANAYEQQRQAAANALAQSMGITPAAAAGILPGLMNNGATAGLSQGVLGQLQGQLAY